MSLAPELAGRVFSEQGMSRDATTPRVFTNGRMTAWCRARSFDAHWKLPPCGRWRDAPSGKRPGARCPRPMWAHWDDYEAKGSGTHGHTMFLAMEHRQVSKICSSVARKIPSLRARSFRNALELNLPKSRTPSRGMADARIELGPTPSISRSMSKPPCRSAGRFRRCCRLAHW
jgi:hypothetical protein